MKGKQKKAAVKEALAIRAELKKFSITKEGEEPKLRTPKHLKPSYNEEFPGGFYRVAVSSKRWIKVAVEDIKS